MSNPRNSAKKFLCTSKPLFIWTLILTMSYAICLGLLVSKQSLWLDEILDLMGARIRVFSHLIQYVKSNPGAVPLGYLAQAAAIRIFGLSAFAGRLPSMLASLAGCAGVYILAHRIVGCRSLLAVSMFAVCPIQLRYALEARSYALALAFSIWGTISFFSLLQQPNSVSLRLSYGFFLIAGLYTQPYSFFVPLAHIAWLCLTPEHAGKRRFLIIVVLIVSLSALLFMPWWFYASGMWKESISASGTRGQINFRSFVVILHELLGMGYIGTGLALFGVLLAVTSVNLDRNDLLFWILYAVIPIASVLLTDRVLGYFLATRQMIFVIPPLIVLLSLTVERAGRLGVAIGLIFFVAAIWNDVKLFNRPRENWQAAAGLLKQQSIGGACVVFAPEGSAQLYAFFVPELFERECPDAGFSGRAEVALAISPYDLNAEYVRVEKQLTESGYSKVGELNPNRPRIEIFRRK